MMSRGRKEKWRKVSKILKKRCYLDMTNHGPEKKHHKKGLRERSAIKPSWRPYDNFSENFAPLNAKCVDIM